METSLNAALRNIACCLFSKRIASASKYGLGAMKAELNPTQHPHAPIHQASVRSHQSGVRKHKLETVVNSHKTRFKQDSSGIEIGLNAAIIAVKNDEPMVLIVREPADMADNTQATDGLPFGPFSPLDHRTLEIGLRSWVSKQTGLELGYVEQLYTFGDRGRHTEPAGSQPHVVSIGYLALTKIDDIDKENAGEAWRSWYHYFPCEDWRSGRPEILDTIIVPALQSWAGQSSNQEQHGQPLDRHHRVRLCFGLEGSAWDEEKVLERYELLFEAGLTEEAMRGRTKNIPADGIPALNGATPPFGACMRADHRRILATAIGRVRAKIKYRPVIFELMVHEFTLFELQKTVEAILGPHLHKQNFRRLVESAGLVEPTGEVKTRTGGRPAKLFRFRKEVLMERPAPGVRVKPPGRV